MSNISYYTKEGLDRLIKELQDLKTKGRARDKGDLSENEEYDAAIEAQWLLELKISKL